MSITGLPCINALVRAEYPVPLCSNTRNHQRRIAGAANVESATADMLRSAVRRSIGMIVSFRPGRCRERRQLGHVPQIVLNDDLRFKVVGDLLEPANRCERRGAIGVEHGHEIALEVLAVMCEVARNEHIAHLRELLQQAVMPRGLAGMLSTTTLPSPNTLLSAASGSTLLPPLIHGVNAAGLVAAVILGSLIASQSPVSMGSVALKTSSPVPHDRRDSD